MIEGLISRRQVHLVCGTTTLAQGMNFPIASVIVESLKKGNEDLTYQDFWNIAGRAGRALVDTVGVIAFPTGRPERLSRVRQFLHGEAERITSQLAALLIHADEIGERFDMATLRSWPDLSTLLQFLSHTMRISGGDVFIDDIEDILRSSLVYHQVEDDERMQRLIRLCRSYLLHIRGESRACISSRPNRVRNAERTSDVERHRPQCRVPNSSQLDTGTVVR